MNQEEQVWQVYRDHWARENLEKGRRLYSRKCLRKTMQLIYSWVTEGGEDIADPSDFEWFQRELLYELESPLLQINAEDDDEARLEDQMTTLKQIAEILCPSQISVEVWNDDASFLDIRNSQLERGNNTPINYIPPAEKRLTRNCGKGGRYKFIHMDLSADEIRRADAVLALF